MMSTNGCGTTYVLMRLLTITLVVALAVLGPSPVSLCALASSFTADCAAMPQQPQCNEMNMDEAAGPALSAGTASCCVVSQAPLPETANTAQVASAAVAPVVVAILAITPGNVEEQRSANVHQNPSPPERSSLCTFLI